MALKEKDFIEIKFTGKTDSGEIFDSNIKEDLEKQGIKAEQNRVKPFIYSLGQNMFLKAIDDFLIGKPEEKKSYTVSLTPEKAFGLRKPELIQRIPMRVFKQHNTNPIPGAMFNFDGKMGKILTSSSGRVIVDFNNSLAGKNVEYKIEILRKVTDIREQVSALNDFFFRKEIPFEEKDKKIILSVDKELLKVAEMLKDSYKEILGTDIEIKEKSEGEDKGKRSDTKSQ